MIVTSSPHLHTTRTTRKIMADVLIALSPAAVAAVVLFGWQALCLLSVSVATAILSELLWNLLMKKPQTVGDLSAVVTGLLLGLTLPAGMPLWQVALGAVFAIIVVKCLFGGIGKNFANPAIAARVMLLLAFPGSAGAVTAPLGTDLVSSATPLAVMNGEKGVLPTVWQLLIGQRLGAVGESCILALVAGGIYLLVRRVITWHTPVIYIGTVFVLTFLLKQDVTFAVNQMLAGGLFIGAIFMATDYVTSPFTPWGKVIFAVGCGGITVLIRFFGSYPEGVSFAILLMNILNPYIEKWTARRPLGGAAK